MEDDGLIPSLQGMYDARICSLLSVYEQRKAVGDAMRDPRVMASGHLRTTVATVVLEELLEKGFDVVQEDDEKYRVSWVRGPPVHVLKKKKTHQ